MIFLSNVLQFYTSYYPIIMTIVWLIGSWISGVRVSKTKQQEHVKTDKVTILLSMFNEEENIIETLQSFTQLEYSNFDVVIVDDKSNDHSVKIVKKWLNDQVKITVNLIELSKNIGKAQALNEAIKQIDSPYILVTDADSLLASNAINKLLQGVTNERVAAVTGKPIVRNRTTLLGRLQALEYVGIIDRIKRAQDNLYGGIMTVAGVVVLYRKKALLSVNGFDRTAITEDIDITWRLRKNQWLIRYTPESLAYILVPETFRGYFKQRIRWSIGGLEVFLKNIKWAVKQGSTYQKMLLLDMFLSHIWAWLAVITLCQYILLTVTTKTFSLPGGILLLYISLFFIMFFQGLIQDKGQSMLTVQDIFALPFYSTFYWFTSLVTAIISQFNIVFFHKQKGSWKSPDRGR